MFVRDARQAVRKFLTIKYTELPESGEVLVTSGFGEMVFFGTSGEAKRSVYVVEGREQDGSKFTFATKDFQLRFGNAVLQPRFAGSPQFPGSSVYVYRDHQKGVRLSGFEIFLRGTSQSAPLFELIKDALINASGRGDLARVKALLTARATERTKTDTAAMASSWTSALSCAAEEGHLEVVRALLDAKVELNAGGVNSALIPASGNGHLEVVQALLAAKADVNAKADDGPTALMVASQNGHLEVVQALLGAKADVNVKAGPAGVTALMLASQQGHQEVSKLLRSAGASSRAAPTR